MNQIKNLYNFLVFALISFGIFLSGELMRVADAGNTAATSATVTGAAPTISGAPSDGGITSTNPINVGGSVTFTATGNDANSDQYYLAVCRTDAITAVNNATPTCTGGEFCYSVPTNSDAQATCATTTAAWMAETSSWYAFVCDKTNPSQCSASSQGTGDNGSPFHVNHQPSFTNATNNGPKNPGASITVTATASDADSTHSDTVFLLVCKTQGISGTQCDGGNDDTWCSSTLSASNPSCNFNVPTPAAHGSTSTYVYVFDSHNFGASGAVQNSEEAITVNDVAPTVSNVTLNSGSSIDVSSGGEGPTGSVNISATGDVTDNNGCTDVSSVTTSAYTTDIGAGGCSAQTGNSCYYNVSCTGGSCTSGITKTYTCTINFKYHADPTDSGAPKDASTWKNTIYASDGSAQGSGELSTGIDLLSYRSISVSDSIAYGSLQIGQITNGTALPQPATVNSTGNTGLDVNIKGTDMTGSGTIAATYQKYATTAVAYSAGTSLTNNDVLWALRVKKPTTTAHISATTTYWGLQIPSGTAAGSYTGTNTFTSVTPPSGSW